MSEENTPADAESELTTLGFSAVGPPPSSRRDFTIPELYQCLQRVHAWAVKVRDGFVNTEHKDCCAKYGGIPDLPEVELLRAISIGSMNHTIKEIQFIRRDTDKSMREFELTPAYVQDQQLCATLSDICELLGHAFKPPAEVRAHNVQHSARLSKIQSIVRTRRFKSKEEMNAFLESEGLPPIPDEGEDDYQDDEE